MEKDDDYAKHTIGMSMGGDEEYESKLLKIIDGGEMTKLQEMETNYKLVELFDCIIYYFWDDKLGSCAYYDRRLYRSGDVEKKPRLSVNLIDRYMSFKDIYHWWRKN